MFSRRQSLKNRKIISKYYFIGILFYTREEILITYDPLQTLTDID